MEMRRGTEGNTDLIDVSDIEPQFDEEPETERGGRAAPPGIPGVSRQPEHAGPTIATLKDRFAAFVIDVGILYVAYWVMMVVYRTVAIGAAAGPIPAWGTNGLLFHGLFLFVALIWFVVPEAAFAASLGKALCHLTVRRVDGAHPSFFGVLIRNIMRPLDLLLFPLVIMAAVLEWSGWHQRLGDLIGRTVVLRKLSHPPRQYALSLDIIGTATGRAIAFAIDFALFGAFAFGWALLLSPEAPLTSMFLVVLFPAAAVSFFVLPEWMAKTSPGKWIAGYAVCQEDGSAIDLPSALIRALWLPFDITPVGFFTCLFSLRRQRPGDAAAGTVVISAQREWRGIIGLAVVLLLSGSVLSGGLKNRDSFLHEDFQVNFLPSIDISGKLKGSTEAPANLSTRNFRFAAGDAATVRKPSIFQPGETLYIVFEVEGYQVKEGKVWIQEDLNVRYPDDSVGLKLENINDFNQELDQTGPIRFTNNIAIPEGAQPGRYTVTMTIRDKLARQELKEQRFFYVTPAESPGQQAQPPSKEEEGAPQQTDQTGGEQSNKLINKGKSQAPHPDELPGAIQKTTPKTPPLEEEDTD